MFIAAWSGAYGPDEDQLWPEVQNIRQAVFRASPSATGLVTFPKLEVPWKSFPPPEVNVRPWVITFSVICFVGAISLFAYTALGYYASLQASRSLFLNMLKRLVRAPSRFLDVTPIGRILNRFTAGLVLDSSACSRTDRETQISKPWTEHSRTLRGAQLVEHSTSLSLPSSSSG